MAEYNAIMNGLGATSDMVSVKMSNGTASIPRSVYNQLEPLYTKAYGIAYTYNLPEPKWDKFLEGKGNEVIVELAFQAYEKNPNQGGDWAYEVLNVINNNPNPNNKKKIIIAIAAAVILGGALILTSNKRKK